MLDILASEVAVPPPAVAKPLRKQGNRTRPATLVYRVLMQALEARRRELGLSFERLNDLAGVQDGYAQKMIFPNSPTGRQSKWETVDEVVQALFGTDYQIQIKPKNYRPPPARPIRSNPIVNSCNGPHWRRQQMFALVLSELGRRGGQARAKLGPEKLRAIGRKAAKTRLRKARKARRQGEQHKKQALHSRQASTEMERTP